MTEKKGFTLIELIVALGIMVIVLPTTTLFLLQILQEQTEAQAELQMEQAASLLLSELRTELTEATSINITGSTLGSDSVVLIFVDRYNETVTIDSVADGAVTRLRLQRGTDPAVFLTSDDIDVAAWRIDAARSDDASLTGLHFHLDLVLINPEATPYRDVTFTGETTIALNPQTQEL